MIREICNIYNQGFKNENKIKIVKHSNCISSRHLYQIRVSNRDEVMEYLNANDIFPGVHYKDNTQYDLYSYVLGRVDNEDLRYTTSLTTLTEEARAVRPSRDVSVKPTRITRPRKPVAKIQKPVKRQPKKTSKGGY